MFLQNELKTGEVIIQKINNNAFSQPGIQLDILRLDKIHPVVSGNKWFKLKYYLKHAIENNYTAIATFGGAFSNHILATAYACNKQSIPCIGFIRGEEPKQYSQTLVDVRALNMQLEFISRKDYKTRQAIMHENTGVFFIPEGGYGKTGAKGAAEIVQLVPTLSIYDYIVCAVGTGTMLAGIANATKLHQQCIGVSVMKNNFGLENEMLSLVDDEARPRVTLLNNYHFGGYAKYTQQLIDFMNTPWLTDQLPLDFVYTGKAFYAISDLSEKGYFPRGSNILFIHSGGLQGNRSFTKEVLMYV